MIQPRTSIAGKRAGNIAEFSLARTSAVRGRNTTLRSTATLIEAVFRGSPDRRPGEREIK